MLPYAAALLALFLRPENQSQREKERMAMLLHAAANCMQAPFLASSHEREKEKQNERRWLLLATTNAAEGGKTRKARRKECREG